MFVIYVSTEDKYNDLCNEYGYYTGKCYTKDGLNFPITDKWITK